MTAPGPGTGPSTARTYLLVDLDDELVETLHQVEELLLTLAGWEEDIDTVPGPFALPAPLAQRAALDALNRVQDAVRGTQTRTDHSGRELPRPAGPGQGRLLGPDGRYEHRPLRLPTLDPADVDVLGAAAAALGHALGTAPGSDLAEAMLAGAEAAAPTYGPAPTPDQLVEDLARAHGLLDLADTDDTAVLRARLVTAAGGDVVLTPAEETSYQRLITRTNAMWTSSDPLARWLY